MRREQGAGEAGEEFTQTIFLNYLPTSHLPTSSPLTNFADWASWQRQSSLAQQLLAEDPRRQLILLMPSAASCLEMRRFRDRGCWFMEVQRQFQQVVGKSRAQQHGGSDLRCHECPATTPARSHCTCPCHWLYPHYWAVVRYSSLALFASESAA